MADIMVDFLMDILRDTVEKTNGGLIATLTDVLRIENLLARDTVITAAAIKNLYWYTYSIVSYLVILKFLWKGFSTWILWRDGDADSSPQDMLIGAIQATVLIMAFPALYEIMADVTIEFADGILSSLALDLEVNFFGGLLMGGSVGIFDTFLRLIFVVLAFVLRIKLIGRGFELIIMRIGIPFASVGLLDSDYGIFKSYIQIIYRTLFTGVIQVAMLSVSLLMMVGGNFILSFAAIITAFNAPVIMQQILVATGRGGGGLTSKIYTGSMAIRAFHMLKGG